MEDVQLSIPRTIAQQTLRIVSIVMAILAAVLVLGGVLVVWSGLTTDGSDVVGHTALDGATMLGVGTVLGFGALIVASGVLLAVTSRLGLRAARDSAKVGPYRFLCYLVGLVTLVAIVWGWGAGTVLLFHPVVLMITVTYVLVCSTLADQVQREHDEGIVGPAYWRTHHQRTLHLVSCVVIIMSAMQAVMAVVLYILVGSFGANASLGMVGSIVGADGVSMSTLVSGIASAVVDLFVGMLGVRGSNHPEKILPYLVISCIGFAVDAARLVMDVVANGLAGVQGSSLADMVFMGACAFLAWSIRRQPRLSAEVLTEG